MESLSLQSMGNHPVVFSWAAERPLLNNGVRPVLGDVNPGLKFAREAQGFERPTPRPIDRIVSGDAGWSK